MFANAQNDFDTFVQADPHPVSTLPTCGECGFPIDTFDHHCDYCECSTCDNTGVIDGANNLPILCPNRCKASERLLMTTPVEVTR